MNSRISLAAIAALIALAAPATAAHASIAQVDTAGGTTRLVVHGGSGVDFIHVSAAGDVVTVEDEAGISAGPGCERPAPADTTVVTCVSELEGLPFGDIQFAGWGGNDGLYVDTALPNGAGAHIQGGDGHDIIQGSPELDVIQPGSGQDHVTAMGGDDMVLAGTPDENDTFDLGDGAADLVDYGNRPSAVRFSMSQTTAGQGRAGTGSEADVLEGVEQFRGTNLGDQFTGGPGAETFWAGGGDDELLGQGGGDVLEAGSGDDYVDGGSDDDTLAGDAGADTLIGGDHDDTLDARDATADVIACDHEESEAPGSGDVARLDALDPDDAACEILAPRFSDTPAIAGAVRVGATLSLAGAQTAARPAATVQVTWWSCATAEWDDCVERATSATYVPAAADLGRFLYAEAYAHNGGEAWTETDMTEAVAPALTASGGTPGDVREDPGSGRQPAAPIGSAGGGQQPVPSPPPSARPTPPGADALARQLLSSAVARLRGRVLGRLARGLVLRLTADAPGTAVVELVAAGKPTVLARGKRAYAAAGAGAISVRLTKAGAKLRRAKTSKLRLRVRFTPAGGRSATRSRTVTLKR